jgi:A/G-specific adenine glycosylase
VLARLFAHDASASATRRWAWEVARSLVPSDGGAGAWNQALMELGATVCTPREPRCGACPLSSACAARARGLVAALPRAKPRSEPVEVELAIAVAARGGALLMEQRPPRGRMASMWQFPTAEVAPDGRAASGLFPRELPRAGGRPLASEGEPLGEIRHTITRHRIRARVFAAAIPRGEVAPPLAWVSRQRAGRLALTGMTRKILRSGMLDTGPASRRSSPSLLAPMSRR